jgi:hypothetical protein
MKVMVIPEDPTLDQFIIKPVVECALVDAGVTGSVEVLYDPCLRGSSEALDPKVIGQIIADNRMIRLFILVIDLDCNRKNHETKLAALCSPYPNLIGCLAVQEVEAWMLALHLQGIGISLDTLRNECDPKETYAEPFLVNSNLSDGVGGGRKAAMREISGKFNSLKNKCPEIKAMVREIKQWADQQV